jgi:hypothetical protein
MAGDRAAINDQLISIQTRLNDLETAAAAGNSSAAGLQSGLDSLRKDQAALQTSLDRLDQLEKELNGFETVTSYNATQVASLRAPDGQIASLKREVQTLKALNLLTRAEVNLAQNNFGLAKDDVMAARAVLLALRDTTPASEQPALDGWIARLDLSMANMLSFPLVASNDLEAAYQLIAAGMAPPPPTPGPLVASSTPTAYVILNEAATPTPTAVPALPSTPTAGPLGPGPTPTAFVTTTGAATVTPFFTNTPAATATLMRTSLTATMTPTGTVTTTATATAKP